MKFKVGDILQHKFHVNEGKFNPVQPTIFVERISKNSKTITGLRYKKRNSTYHKDYNEIKIGEPFTGCNDGVEFYVKIF